MCYWWKRAGSGALSVWLRKRVEIWTVEASTGNLPARRPVDSPPHRATQYNHRVTSIGSTLDALIQSSHGRQAGSTLFDPALRAQLEALLAGERDAATQMVALLGNRGSFKDYETGTGVAAVWESLVCLYRDRGRFHEALLIAFELYRSMLAAERQSNQRLHKGMPLVYMADAYGQLGYFAHEERYLMLTLCEDAIRGEGIVDPNITGIYFRLVWGLGYSDNQVSQYAKEFYRAYQAQSPHRFFPEALLQDIDPQRRWQLRPPSPAEMSVYATNVDYLAFLLSQVGDGTGEALERLAEYLLSCMAGCRAQRRRHSLVTEYDVVCSMNGNYFDFRSEFGRYFVCECKDWKKRAGISVIAKFCRILDSTKARFGILFSSEGLAGMEDAEFAAREQQKIFQDRGLVIVVVDKHDIESVVAGENFIQVLRQKYEAVRLDLDPRRLIGPSP